MGNSREEKLWVEQLGVYSHIVSISKDKVEVYLGGAFCVNSKSGLLAGRLI
jgi:hypothetical protein